MSFHTVKHENFGDIFLCIQMRAPSSILKKNIGVPGPFNRSQWANSERTGCFGFLILSENKLGPTSFKVGKLSAAGGLLVQTSATVFSRSLSRGSFGSNAFYPLSFSSSNFLCIYGCIDMYVNMLEANHITVTVRRSRGKDIDAACGQLANKLDKKEKTF